MKRYKREVMMNRRAKASQRDRCTVCQRKFTSGEDDRQTCWRIKCTWLHSVEKSRYWQRQERTLRARMDAIDEVDEGEGEDEEEEKEEKEETPGEKKRKKRNRAR